MHFAFFSLQVCQWLLALGMESYITLFMDKTISGTALLNLDSSGLKELGIKNKEDREKIKKKIKELKSHNEREKRDMEKKAAAAAAASNSSAAAGSSSGGGSRYVHWCTMMFETKFHGLKKPKEKHISSIPPII